MIVEAVQLPLARYRFTARVQQPLALPHYAGSLLRGQFGAALRDVACMTRAPACPGCPLIQTCPYTRIFEAPPPPKGAHALQDFSQIPNAYVLEPPSPGAKVLEAGRELVFHMVLIGHATAQLALIIFALQRTLARGLTRERAPSELLQVDWLDAKGTAHPVWTAQQPRIAEYEAALTLPEPNALKFIVPKSNAVKASAPSDHQITLQLLTPLRLQSQGQPLGLGQVSTRALIAGLARRTALLMEFHGDNPLAPGDHGSWGNAAKHATALAGTIRDTQELQWYDWTRYSSRQQQAMTLGGLMGRWTLYGSEATLHQLWPWLWLGQWLHVGKNATMGMGGYTLTH